jgi:hypothetical protein
MKIGAKNKMANQETAFVDFIRGCHNPKLKWVSDQLDLLGVQHRTHGVGITGPILQVEAGKIEVAHSVLTLVVGMMNLGGTLTDDTIKVMDLVDTHPLFVSDTDIEDLPFVSSVQAPAPPKPEGDPVEPPVPAIIENEIFKEPTLADPSPLQAIDVAPEVEAEPDPLEEPVVLETADEDDDLWATDETDDDDPFADDEPVEPGDVSDEENPELDYLRAEKVLTHNEEKIPGVSDPITMYEVSSSNLSKIGNRINQEKQELCTVYTFFKGGAEPYRYGPVMTAKYNDILSEAVRAGEGRQEASVGSLYHHLIKVDAEAGDIKCQRLVNGKWADVPPKKDRLKLVKNKHAKAKE